MFSLSSTFLAVALAMQDTPVPDTTVSVAAEVVVTGSRSEMLRKESPVLVTTTDARMMRAVQSVSLADGLSFQPGLRIENDCQNCGFTQVRMNGLQGPYTQILIDSRPVVSALSGVYGLEQIPASLVERIEVVRGGGSALYGSNAIAGTINIITREPNDDLLESSAGLALIGGTTPDITASATGAFAFPRSTGGATATVALRERQGYDRDGDGFTELPELHLQSLGMKGAYRVGASDRISMDARLTHEYRRGGDQLSLPPEQALIAEQLDHMVVAASVGHDHFFDNATWKLSSYASAQHTDRASYYGAYGSTTDLIGVIGTQVTHDDTWLNGQRLFVVGGVEGTGNSVHDDLPSYERVLDQRTSTLGTFVQSNAGLTDDLTLSIGLRYDRLAINSVSALGDISTTTDRSFNVVTYRTAAMLNVGFAQLRATYATGFRGPQAFDEDLHISTLGGDPRIVLLSPTLQPERSQSVSASIDAQHAWDDHVMSWTLDGFSTYLAQPFIIQFMSAATPNTPAVAMKRNGDPAWVMGLNAEARYTHENVRVQATFTAQSTRYTADGGEVIFDSGDTVRSSTFMRTPDLYGSVIASWGIMSDLLLDASLSLTGPMFVPNERLQAVLRSPWFADASLRLTYSLPITTVPLRMSAGVVNIFDSYQRDIETGPTRDASYVYGPIRPRTFQLSLTFGIP